MTLKEELEILRGEPIQVFTGDPMDIPCIETSDPERLCKHPVVSVNMITYNHEPYIRQAIEGVMMQKTDFEFELVIGEDCSTDKTREICFEYQKRYPDKIRVLWCDHNLYRNPHSAGGNYERNTAHCRGEFVALCEGDDYWIDPLKLQKQVDIMRKYPNVGFCFCGALVYSQEQQQYSLWSEAHKYQPGIQSGNKFFLWMLSGFDSYNNGGGNFVMTASTMYRVTTYNKAISRYEVYKYALRLGDATVWLGLSSLSDGYYMPDVVSCYRVANTGIFQNPISRTGVQIDGVLVRLYFVVKVLGLGFNDLPRNQWRLLLSRQSIRLASQSRSEQLAYFRALKSGIPALVQQFPLCFRPYMRAMERGCLSSQRLLRMDSICARLYVPYASNGLRHAYAAAGLDGNRRILSVLGNKNHIIFFPVRCLRRFLHRIKSFLRCYHV